MTRPFRKFTQAEKDYVRTYAGHLPLTEVCRRLGRSQKQVLEHANAQGVTFTAPAGLRSARQVADHFKVTIETVARWASQGCPHIAATAHRQRVRRFYDINEVARWLMKYPRRNACGKNKRPRPAKRSRLTYYDWRAA